jgi:hypothetical protein
MFTIRKEISKDIVERVIVGAIEGGSNYWYFLSQEAVDTIKSTTKEMHSEPLAMRLVESVKRGYKIPINDYENVDEVLGHISLKTMGKRTEKLIKDGHGLYLEHFSNENDDATSADVVFQYWVMGELVFG